VRAVRVQKLVASVAPRTSSFTLELLGVVHHRLKLGRERAVGERDLGAGVPSAAFATDSIHSTREAHWRTSVMPRVTRNSPMTMMTGIFFWLKVASFENRLCSVAFDASPSGSDIPQASRGCYALFVSKIKMWRPSLPRSVAGVHRARSGYVAWRPRAPDALCAGANRP